MTSPTFSALVHHPIRDREGQTVTSAVTNVDVHDIARSSRTYGLEGFFIVTPIAAQRELVGRILGHWSHGSGAKRIPERSEALARCEAVSSIDDAVARIEEMTGKAPRIIATSARKEGRGVVSFEAERANLVASDVPTLILFGTGHGLAEEAISRCIALVEPIRAKHYNHLSVRAAAAIVFDRLFGDG
jgi:hypothetical protein